MQWGTGHRWPQLPSPAYVSNALTETGMNSALTGAKGWTPPCQNSTCVFWLLWGSFHLLSDHSTKQKLLPYIYVRKGRSTTYILFLCTHRNHFTSKPGLLNKTIKTSESWAKMLKNLCSQISLCSHCEWSPFPWICGNNSLTSSFRLGFFLQHPTSFSSLNCLQRLCRRRTWTVPPKANICS